jgi:hypothetical protein
VFRRFELPPSGKWLPENFQLTFVVAVRFAPEWKKPARGGPLHVNLVLTAAKAVAVSEERNSVQVNPGGVRAE